MNIVPEKISLDRSLSFFNREELKRPCWSCDSEIQDLYNCSNCTALQQFLKETDYFNLFGLGYFLTIDLENLEEQYYTLSRKFHPDYFQKTSEEEQMISLENTAQLTKAYRVLKNPKKRMAYLIQLTGEHSDVSASAPSELFEEILEIQEHLEALSSAQNEQKPEWISALEDDLEAMEGHSDTARGKLSALSSEWDGLEGLRVEQSYSNQQRSCLSEMKLILSHNGYLDRIVEEIRETLDASE